MRCAENSSVGADLPQLGELFIECVSVDTEVFSSERLCHGLHLRGNGCVVIGEVGVAALGIGNAKAVAGSGKIEFDRRYFRLCGVTEVDSGESAYRADYLVHKSASLAEIDVFGVLSYLCNFNSSGSAVVEAVVDNSADEILKCSRGRESAAAEDVGGHVGVEASCLNSHFSEFSGNSADKSGGCAFFLRDRGEVGEVYLERLVSL